MCSTLGWGLMRRATKGSWLWLVTAVLGLTVGGQGCDRELNPQPLPPNGDLANGNASSSGAGGGASYSGEAGGPSMLETDASTATPTEPRPDGGNSARDGGGDATGDGGMSADAGSDGAADAALDADGASSSDGAPDAEHPSDSATDSATDALEGATDVGEGGE